MKELDTEKKMIKIVNAMEIVEISQSTIARKALAFILVHEDEDEAFELLKVLRYRTTLDTLDAFTIDGYLHNLNNLKMIADMSNQTAVSKDLGFLINYFGKNTTILYRILRVMKRHHIHEGLRQNYMNN